MIAGSLALTGCGEKDSGDSTTGATTLTTTSATSGEGETGTDATGATSLTTTSEGEAGETTLTTTSEGGATDGFVNTDSSMSCGDSCDIWAANDCSDGQKCTSVACAVGSTAWDSNVCRDIQGTKTLGDDCEYLGSGIDGNDDCGDGLLCWNQDADTMLGTCLAFCTGSAAAPTCATGTSCVIANDGVLPICLPGCDPLSQDCTNANDLCLPDFTQTGFVCVLDASGGMAPYGTPCSYANSCNEGLICIAPEAVPEAACATASGCCSPMCDITDTSTTCPGQGQVCESLYEAGMEPPGFDHMGVCAVPA